MTSVVVNRRLHFALCWLVVSSMACSVDRTVRIADAAIVNRLVQYEHMDATHRLSLAVETEPGQRLVILGRVISQEGRRPLPNHRIMFFQANHEGDYDETTPGEESTARIRGYVVSDSLGRFLVSTVLPGDYGSTADNRHIHMTVLGAKPEAYDFYFKQYINRGLLAWARRSDQAVVLDLTEADNILLAVADLPVRGFDAATVR